MYSAYESTDEIFVKRYYKNLGTHWINVKNMRYCFQLPHWILLFHEDCCFPLEVPRINIMIFIFFISMLFWCPPDLAETWHTQMKYRQKLCSWSLSKQHQKRKCQKFQKKACFHEISCLHYIQTCPNSSDNLQLNSSLLHSDRNQVVELYHCWMGTIQEISFKKIKRHLNRKGHLDTKILGLTAWTLASFPALAPDAWFQAIPLLVLSVDAFHSLLISDKNFQPFLPLRKVTVSPQFL